MEIEQIHLNILFTFNLIMSEPILRVKPISYGRRNYLRYIPAIIVIALVWFVGIVLAIQYKLPNWEYALLNLFFALITAYVIWAMIRSARENRLYRSIRDFALYRDYAWFITVDGEEVTIPISDLNPCVIKYTPPVRNLNRPWWYYPGWVELLISYNDVNYTILLSTDQCRQLNQVLMTDFGKSRIDWCGEKEKKAGPVVLTRPKLAC